MANTKGWSLLLEHIESNINSLEAKVMNSKFQSLEEFYSVRNEIKSFKGIIDYVEKRVQKVNRGDY